MEYSLDKLRELIETLRQGEVGEFEFEDETVRLRLNFGKVQVQEKAQATVVASAAAPVSPLSSATATEAALSADVAFVTSPFVGTFYRSASPEAAPFVQPGQSIEKGQTLCIVEAMKLMNEIESDTAGTLLEIMAENGSSVEFGQRLFKIRKARVH
jgi:acetyl-CoA carboxylase biotin carboxyl carrier protein